MFRNKAKETRLNQEARQAELNDAYFEVQKRETRSFRRNVIIGSVIAAALVGFGLTQFFSTETLKDCVAYEQLVTRTTQSAYVGNGVTVPTEVTKIYVSTSCGDFEVNPSRTKVEWLLNGRTYDLQVNGSTLINATERS